MPDPAQLPCCEGLSMECERGACSGCDGRCAGRGDKPCAGCRPGCHLAEMAATLNDHYAACPAGPEACGQCASVLKRATTAIDALSAVLLSGEPDLWQYAMPAEDEPDGVMPFEGRPRSMSPRYLRRPLRAIGPWEQVPTDG